MALRLDVPRSGDPLTPATAGGIEAASDGILLKTFSAIAPGCPGGWLHMTAHHPPRNSHRALASSVCALSFAVNGRRRHWITHHVFAVEDAANVFVVEDAAKPLKGSGL
jgi:hypothetical protein